MTILAFDTATRATAVGLCEPSGRSLEARDDPPPGERPRHNTRLMGLIVELIDRAQLQWEAIERIAVGVGPGTFTGLRIGIATARALADTRSIPLIGISTLQSLAVAAFGAEPAAEEVVAVLDARRGEVFAAGWQRGGEGEPFLAPVAITPAALADVLRSRASRPLAVGEGAVAFQEVLERAGASIPQPGSTLHRVTAVTHCRLATGPNAQTPEQVQPQYLRLPDAEIARASTGSK